MHKVAMKNCPKNITLIEQMKVAHDGWIMMWIWCWLVKPKGVLFIFLIKHHINKKCFDSLLSLTKAWNLERRQKFGKRLIPRIQDVNWGYIKRSQENNNNTGRSDISIPIWRYLLQFIYSCQLIPIITLWFTKEGEVILWHFEAGKAEITA